MEYFPENNVIDITPNLERKSLQEVLIETRELERFNFEGIKPEVYSTLKLYPRPILGAAYINNLRGDRYNITQKIIFAPGDTHPQNFTQLQEDFIEGYDRLITPYQTRAAEINEQDIMARLRQQTSEIVAENSLRTVAAVALYKPAVNKAAVCGLLVPRAITPNLQYLFTDSNDVADRMTMYEWFKKNYDVQMASKFPQLVAATFLPKTEDIWSNWSDYFVE